MPLISRLNRAARALLSWHSPCSLKSGMPASDDATRPRLRILHLEDDPDFCQLVRSLFELEGLEVEWRLVSDETGFQSTLALETLDVILADYQLPSYNGLEALRYARATNSEVPFLLVSGTIGEQAAIDSLKAGATDYVLKLWPERLVPAVRRAVSEAQERRQRRKAETDLERSEEQYRLIFDGNPTPMCVFDQETLEFLEVNAAAVKYYGYSREDFLAMSLREVAAPDNMPALIEYLPKLLGGHSKPGVGFAGTWRHRRKDGAFVDVEIKWSPITFKGRAASLSIINDITERKRVEHRDAVLSRLGQSLSSATSPAEAARIIKGVTEELFSWDAFTLDLYSSERDKVYPILNIDTNQEGVRFEIPVTGLGKDPTGMARRVIERGAELILREEPVVMPADVEPIGDTARPSRSLALVPIRNRTKVIGILSVQSYELRAYTNQDLSLLQTLADHCGGALERIRAEAALRASELLFHSVWENSVDGMRLTDERGRTVAVNQAFCKLVGMSREELEDRDFTVIYAEAEHPKRLLERYRQQFSDRSMEKQSERRLTLRNGQVVTLEHTYSFVELRGQSPLLLALFRDVTEQKRLEEQLRHAQKMDAIGQLAGGVAHDFNNILTVISGHASLLQSGAGLAGPAARSAQQIGQAAERAAALTRQLLTFSRRQIMQPRRLDLNDVVRNMTTMLARILGEDIALQLHYAAEPAPVKADAGMLEQILLNLVINSRDAMPKGGTLALKISIADTDAQHLAQHSEARAGRFVCLTVNDTGCGIPSENLRRVFEPFFTTKEVGKGTGLGLATVYGIVKQHQGWIEVDSQVNRGTTFKVFLPASPQPPPKEETTLAEKKVLGGNETILVVEDEAPVRELVCDLLASYGYCIVQAESGMQALELWKECKDRVDLVVTDLIMPDRISGRELAEKLWAERPGLKIIFTSGYSAEVVGKDFVLRRGLHYLQKPYQPDKLASTVRECLDARN